MPKRRMSLRVPIPAYEPPRHAWRRQIHGEAVRAAKARGVSYVPEDELELVLRLHLDDSGLRFHDVDNRLKDIMDALQGRAGGPKSERRLAPIIPNDNQVFRVSVEKVPSRGKKTPMGLLLIRKHRG